jgi:rhomboid protease GluP
MGTLGRILLAALEAVLRLGDAVGVRGARWEWKKQNWRRLLDERVSGWENLERGVRARTRMCPECRTLVPRGDRTCPSCGASLRGVPGGGPGRLLRLLFPSVRPATTVLITANVAMSLLLLVTWGTSEQSSGLFGFMNAPTGAYYVFGEKRPLATIMGEYWRLVTANYLHYGLLHLLMNCYALTSLGPLVEDAFGSRKFFVIYTVCGVFSMTVSMLFSPARSVGASGALFGLMGFGIIFGRFRGGSTGRLVAEQLMRWALYGVLMLFMPGIDNLAHAGGFVAGAALGFVVSPGEPRTRAEEVLWRVLFAAVLLATLGSFVAVGLTYPLHMQFAGQ